MNIETTVLLMRPDEKGTMQEHLDFREQRSLVVRALQGDQGAFSEIVHCYSALMIRVAARMVGDRAEDVVQDSLILAWKNLDDLRESGALRAWLMRIVVTQCISLQRRDASAKALMHLASLERENDLLTEAADYYTGRMERDWDLACAIDGLPEKQRIVILLHYYIGLTLRQMAQLLQVSENTIKKRLGSALTNLRRILDI